MAPKLARDRQERAHESLFVNFIEASIAWSSAAFAGSPFLSFTMPQMAIDAVWLARDLLRPVPTRAFSALQLKTPCRAETVSATAEKQTQPKAGRNDPVPGPGVVPRCVARR